MAIRIGISGWRYAPWRGVFYPPGLAQRRELEFAASRFGSIEINGSFYSLQTPDSYQAWHDATPSGFVFAVKGPRYLTHMLRLRGVEKPLANFLASGLLRLGAKLGPILWQLPAHFAFDAARMRGRSALAIDAVRPLRHALEPRHESFGSRESLDLLRRHDIAMVVADSAGKFPRFEVDTAGFRYLRLHGDEELYVSGYSPAAIRSWATKIRRWARHGDVFCYFDNDAKVHAPFDAMALMQALGLADEVPARPRRTRGEEARASWPGL